MLQIKNTLGSTGGGKPEGLYIWKKYSYADLNIVSWANGTDEEIVTMINAADAGLINLADYWHVGDKRTVTLSAMAATGVEESHVNQTVTFVLMNAGGKTLANATPSGRTECSFIVGMKNCLAERGTMNLDSTAVGGWEACARRTWCNDVFRNAIPSSIRDIFKQHLNITANGIGTTTVTSTDYFALPAEKEVYGSNSFADSTAEASLIQFKYYKIIDARIKRTGDIGSFYDWWTRSPDLDEDNMFTYVGSNGNSSSSVAGTVYGKRALSPFGVI